MIATDLQPIARNQRQTMDGEELLARLIPGTVAACFFDPEYRGVADHLKHGNEGKSRMVDRFALPQMDDATIGRFVAGIIRALRPSGHLFLWVDRYHLVEGSHREWLPTDADVVSMITWDKERMGMGYRARCQSEFLLVVQKLPKRAKGVWTDRGIRDVYREDPGPVGSRKHAHAKPLGLICRLMEAVTDPGDLVLDPAAGGYGVLSAAQATGREFIGCDVAD